MSKKIIRKISVILINNLLMIPNLLKGDYLSRKYVIKLWFTNNLILNDFINRMLLYSRAIERSTSPILNSQIRLDDLLDIYYINLSHRQDRNREIIEEFEGIGLIRFNRYEAVFNQNGALGCAISHRNVIRDYIKKQDRLLMICEDDIKFLVDRNTLEKIIQVFLSDPNLDVLCLGNNHFNQYSYNDYFFLTSDTQTTSCYVIKPHMIDIMLDNFELSVRLLNFGISKIYKPEIDQVWKLLQKKYNFVIPKEKFAIQRESFSDIEKQAVDYKV